MSIAIRFDTGQYFHLVAVDHEQDIEKAIYADLISVGLDKEPFTFRDIYVIDTDNPHEDDCRLEFLVAGIINKFKGENESV